MGEEIPQEYTYTYMEFKATPTSKIVIYMICVCSELPRAIRSKTTQLDFMQLSKGPILVLGTIAVYYAFMI